MPKTPLPTAISLGQLTPEQRSASAPRPMSHLPQIVLFAICALTLLVGLSG